MRKSPKDIANENDIKVLFFLKKINREVSAYEIGQAMGMNDVKYASAFACPIMKRLCKKGVAVRTRYGFYKVV
jgi:hypothetical protein